MAERYVSTQFKIKIEIDGITFDDEVVSVSATYGLNAIPTASATIASGMNGKTGKPSKIHQHLDSLRPRAPAKIILTVINEGGRIEKSPPGQHVIFEGYYAGVGHQRSSTNSNYVLHFVHWLDDLNCASMLNGNWYPGVSNDYAQNALFLNAAGSGATGTPITSFDPNGDLTAQAGSDLWEKVLKPGFKEIAGMHYPNQQGCREQKNNIDLLGPALAKIPGVAPKPAKIPLAGFDAQMRLALNAGLDQMLLNGLGYNSFWSKLVGELAPSFLFAISPGSTFANVIPFFGGLRIQPTVGSAWRVIRLDDYNYSNFNANLAQLIESVNVFYPHQSESGAAGGKDKAAPTLSYCNAFASFPEKPKDIRGTVLVKELPHWLYNMTPTYLYAGQSILPYVDTHEPGKGSTTPTGSPPPPRPPLTINTYKNIADLYAKHWYQTTVLGQRFGEFSGKFRLDIAPGSMIAIEVPPDPPPINPLNGGKKPKYLFASVTQVSFNINAEQHAAGTSFTITNLRNKRENENPDLTNPTPPLYKEKWPGGPLTQQAVGDNAT